MAAVRHLGFVMRVLGPPTKAFGSLYHCAKLGWNLCSSFDNMHVFDFASLACKRLFTPKCYWVWSPKWGAMWTKPKKAHPCASPRHWSHRAWKAVEGSTQKGV